MSAAEEIRDVAITPGGLRVYLRVPEHEELRWLQATWSRSLRRANPARMVHVGGVMVEQRLLSRAHGLLVNDLLGSSSVVVAAMADSPLALAGWAVWDHPVLHYVFVAPEARRLGLGRMLAQATGCTATSHMTEAGRGLIGGER